MHVGFNPRTRDGCENIYSTRFFDFKVSIHAPVMGANAGRLSFDVINYVSIHAPVMGANRFFVKHAHA